MSSRANRNPFGAVLHGAKYALKKLRFHPSAVAFQTPVKSSPLTFANTAMRREPRLKVRKNSQFAVSRIPYR
jgi:hypothetical protein